MKKEKKRKKNVRADCGVAPRVRERKGAARADSRREGDPLVFVNKRFQTCKEREWSAGKKKKKGKPVARAPRG
jgi:hypothetical protein